MNLEEIQKSQKDTRVIAVPTTSIEVASYNPKRYAIIFSLINGTTGIVDLQDAQGNSIALVTGFDLNNPVFKLSANDYGALVHGPWFARAIGSTLNLSVSEVLL